MTQKLIVTQISLMKQQSAVIHTICQTEIPALSDSCITNAPCQDLVSKRTIASPCIFVKWVSMATHYGLESPDIKCWRKQNFQQLFRQALGPTQLPIQWVPTLSRGHSSQGMALTTNPM
jgi:hypothetical protein